MKIDTDELMSYNTDLCYFYKLKDGVHFRAEGGHGSHDKKYSHEEIKEILITRYVENSLTPQEKRDVLLSICFNDNLSADRKDNIFKKIWNQNPKLR